MCAHVQQNSIINSREKIQIDIKRIFEHFLADLCYKILFGFVLLSVT